MLVIQLSFVAFLKITQCIYIDATVSRLPFKNRFLRLDTHQRHNDQKRNHNHNHKKRLLDLVGTGRHNHNHRHNHYKDHVFRRSHCDISDKTEALTRQCSFILHF